MIKETKLNADPVLLEEWLEKSIMEFFVSNPPVYNQQCIEGLSEFIENLPIGDEDQSTAVH